MSALAWLCGVGLVSAALLAWTGLRPRSAPSAWRTGPRALPRPADLARRLCLAGGGAAALGMLTGWPVAAVAGAALGFFGRDLISPRHVRQAPIEMTEAIATWTEQLRDTMAAAAGLQQAIVATAPLAPGVIRPYIQSLALRAERERLVPLLLELADQMADPTADLVITALVQAASGEAQDLGEVLSSLAESARDDATMRRYVDASRARDRTAVRSITVMALVTLVGLLLVGHAYLRPYGTALGQVVLACVLACYGLGVWLLHRMGRDLPPERILSPARAGGRAR